MEKSSDDESLEDISPDDANEEGSEFMEKDPSGRYGRYKEVLGKGAYKTVYKAFDDLDGIEVAWNQVKIHDVLHHAGDIERLYSELHLLKTLKHKNIIKFYTSWVDMHNRNVNFITEIFTSGTLRQYRKKHQHVKLRAIKNWSRQILRGLVFLHSRDPPIIHRDLKCDNIFINGNTGEVKIGDLGLATILRQAPAAQSVIGTPEFMAPELYEEHYNELVDVYSFGMCLLEMLTSEYPYSECTNAAQIYKKVTTGKKPAALGKIKDPETREFVEKCLASASQRLHARELLMDSFLHNDEDHEVQETRVCGSSSFCGSLRSLDPIPEHTCSRSTDSLDEIGKKNQSTNERLSRLDSFPERIIYSDSPSPKEGTKSCMDFRIKGRKQDDKKVLVRIRISNSGGEVRIIQFDFDVDADTAMSVASEMVAELDLSDQDVTIIAEMIDAEIMALIPDWKPGLAFDDAIDDDTDKEQKGLMLETSYMKDETDGLRISVPGLVNDTSDDSQLASGPIYGRFEEVGGNVISLEQQEQDQDGLELFSDFTADTGSDSLDARSSSEFGGDYDTAGLCLEGINNPQSKQGSESGADHDTTALSFEGINDTQSKQGSESGADHDATALNFEGINNILSKQGFECGADHCTAAISMNNPQSEQGFLHSSGERQPEIDVGITGGEHTNNWGDEKPDDSEVGRLIMQQQEELHMLQMRHEEALSYLKARLNQEAVRTCDNNQQSGSSMCEMSGEVSKLSGQQDAFCMYAASEVGACVNEAACSCINILNDPPAAIYESKGPSSASIGQVESALTDSVPIAENFEGNHDIISRETPGAMPRECMFSEQSNLCTEGKHAVGKISVVITEDKLKEAPNKIVMTGMAETRPNMFNSCGQGSKATPETATSASKYIPPINEDAESSFPATQINEDVKSSFPALAKRESYLELYKASNSKDKLSSSKSSESLSTPDAGLKTVCKDANQEQLKKMADFADKLINNLTQSNSKYLGTSSAKNFIPQNGQQTGSGKSHCGTSIQGGQHLAGPKNVPTAAVPNGQNGSGVKSIGSVSNQNVQQCALGKSSTLSVVQTSSVEKLPNCVTLNGQQVACMRTVGQAGQQGVGKCFGSLAQNGQPSAVSMNHTNASVHTTNQGLTTSCLSSTFPSCASAKCQTSGNAQNSQQGVSSTPGQIRQQTASTESGRV